LLCMVGLPGRGKTFLSHRVSHWLEFFHNIPTKVLSLGNFRRKLVGAQVDSDFFDPTNKKAKEKLDQARLNCLKATKAFLKEDEEGKHVGRVAIYDASNITVSDRLQVVAQLKGVLPRAHIIFIELHSTNQTKIDKHIQNVKIKVGMPDYNDVADTKKAISDYKARIEIYKKHYVPIADKTLSFIKLVDDGRQVTMNRIKGFLPGKSSTMS
jgi:6-phosphofructo-2-kinase / fructose-2,6-biphosphatase 2